MTLLCEWSDWLNRLRQQREELLNSGQEPLVEQLYSQSPINFTSVFDDLTGDDLATSFNLRHSFEELRKKRSEQQQNETKKVEERQKCSVRAFAMGNSEWSFAPKTEPLTQTPPCSSLSLSVKQNVEKEETGRDSKGKAPETKPDELSLQLTVFLPHGDPIKLRVPEKTTVEGVIKQAIKQFGMTSSDDINKVTLEKNPRCYLLRAAEDDGTPDDDMPPLVRTQEIRLFRGVLSYALVKDPRFAEILVEEQEKEEERQRRTIFKVYFPSTDNIDYLAVMWRPAMNLGELLTLVKEKKGEVMGNPPGGWGFQYLDAPRGEYLPMDLRMGDLKEDVDGLNLMPISGRPGLTQTDLKKQTFSVEAGDAPRAITKLLGPMFFFTPTTATRYSQYTVVKSTKFGVKQELILGIDAERISISSTDRKKYMTEKATYHLSEAGQLTLLPSKPGHFTIQLKDKSFKFHSNKAEEIVAKITYLQNMIS